jgi:plasmid replication initiation protein
MKEASNKRSIDTCAMSNVLIQSKFSMSTEAQKLIYMSLKKVNQIPDLFKGWVFVSSKEFIDTTGINDKKIYRKLKKAAEEISSTPIEDRQGKEFNYTPWVNECKYQEVNGFMGISTLFNPRLEKYLLELKKNFTLLSVGNIAKLSSKNSIKLYTLLQMNKFRVNFAFSVEDLRFWFDIRDGLYPKFGELKRAVIIPAIKEINEKTNLEVEFIEIKSGRKVTEIKFIVKEKNKTPTAPEEAESGKKQYLKGDIAKENISDDAKLVKVVLDTEEAKKLINLGLSKDKVNELLDNQEHDFLMYALEQSKADTKQGINNRAGYFLSSIDNLKGVWQALKEAKIKQEEQAKEYQQIKEQGESKRAEQNNRWKNIQTEVARDLLEENYILFTKAVAKHLAGASKSSTGSTFTDDFMNVDKAVNLQKTKEVYQKLMQCRDRRDVSNLVKYQEPWLFKTICNTQNNYNWETGKYNMNLYKNISDDVLPEGLKVFN